MALRILLVVAGMALGVLGSPATAMTVKPPAFANLADEADQILRIEVTGASCRWDSAGGRQVIHTYVECRVLRTPKGAEQSTVTLRFFGGQIGNARMSVPDMPALAVGEHYIVFLKNNGRAFCPLLAVMYGNYRLKTDETTGVERVYRSDGEPLRQTQDIRRPMSGEKADRTAAAVGGAMSRDEFESSIISQLKEAAPK